jgi:DNA helicase-2/ATP-dependent DNA helicase PcrA
MKAKEHPEYWLEEKKLQETLQSLRRELESTDPPKQAYGADQRAAVAVLHSKEARVSRLKQVLKELYMGRVDWMADAQPTPEIFYLGKFAEPSLGIYSWRDTLPARLLYEGKCGEPGTLLLSRKLTIQSEQLQEITDEHVHASRQKLLGPSLAAVAQRAPGGVDKLLIELLDQHREGRMHDIVASIQEEQFRLIRSPLNQLLVVQGVPGSGKTAIALHRLSYLLYHHESDAQFARSRVVFLGPNPLFLNYVAPVLPELGERNVPQVAFDEWMRLQIGLSEPCESEADALEELLDQSIPFPQRVMRYRNARHKGSIRMATLLERYVDYLIEQVVADLGPLTVTVSLGRARTMDQAAPTLQATLSALQIQDLILRARNQREQKLAVNSLKEVVQRLIAQTLIPDLHMQALEETKATGSRPLDGQREQIAQQVNRAVEDYLRPWEAINVLNAYRRLLRSSELLQRLGKGLFDPGSLELLHLDAPKQTTRFRFSDLGALLYLAYLLNGAPANTTFDHVVIDEAQDMTPLQFEVLKRWSRNQSFTIMGDMAQSIYSDHGLSSWDELNHVFDATQISRHEVRQSYRSTQPIIEYANQLMVRCGVDQAQLAVPLARTGKSPVEINLGDAAKRSTTLRDIIAQERQAGHKSIAILVKTAYASRRLAEEMRQVGVNDFQLIDGQTLRYNDGLTILPIYLAKGLEFDTVIVADAGAEHYTNSTLDLRLLYVAITRASHHLYIGWQGRITPLLDPSQPKIELHDVFEAELAPKPVTIESFVAQSPNTMDADVVVERLASAGRLYLLDKGRIDQTLLAVLAAEWQGDANSEEMLAPALDAQSEQIVRANIQHLAKRKEPELAKSITLLQLSYGLLRNVLRNAGIEVIEQEEANPQSQAVALTQFLQAIRTTGLPYSAGPLTSERRVLQAVYADWHPDALQLLQLLVAHGIVETFTQSQGRRIRLSYEWIERLLAAALGHVVDELDADLRIQLPLLAHPITQPLAAPSATQVSNLQPTRRAEAI